MATLKQKKAFKMVERGSTMKEVMVGAGYSEKTAIAPTKLTKSKGWKELMDKFLPEKELGKKHRELLNAGVIQHYTFPARIIQKKNKETGEIEKDGNPEDISDSEIKKIVESVKGCKLIYIKIDSYLGGKTAYYQAPDNKSRKDALDMAYKLRGSYEDTKPPVEDPTKSIHLHYHNDKILNIIKKSEDDIKAAIEAEIKNG